MANTYSAHLVSASNQLFKTANGVVEPVFPITIEAWIKPTAVTSRQDIVSKTRTDNTVAYLFTLGNTSGKLTAFFQGGTPVSMNSSASISANVWTHVAVTYDGTTCKIYINGALDNTASISQASINYSGSHPMTVGANLAGDDTTIAAPFNGDIDEVRVWSTLRTLTQISQNYLVELFGNESGLIGYWKFNNNGNDSQINASANNLTAVNTPTYTNSVPFTGWGFLIFF